MRLIVFSILILFTSSFTFAKIESKSTRKQSQDKHRHHGTHSHGSATLSIAFDGLTGKIEFKSPAMDLLGFEHEAKSSEEKKRIETLQNEFEVDITKMIIIDANSRCLFKKDKIAIVADESKTSKSTKPASHLAEHSDFVASFFVNCGASVVGTKISVDFTRYKSLKDIDLTILAGDLQKTAEIKSKPATIELK